MRGSRRIVLLAIVIAGVWAAFYLDLAPGQLIPRETGWKVAREFFSAAIRPAAVDESGLGVSLWGRAAKGAWLTVVFAATSMSLALVLGLVFGLLASATIWELEDSGSNGWRHSFRRFVAPVLYTTARAFIALLRSVHELLWATLFLAAVGLSDATAVLAIAIPYGGTLAKVFSEMIDEAPRGAAHALIGAGASTTRAFFAALLPLALPDMAAYSFYRFECAIRSAAILGFFGIQTLGSFIVQSFELNLYREVWTYLYVLFALVLIVDWWSGLLRRRLVAA